MVYGVTEFSPEYFEDICREQNRFKDRREKQKEESKGGTSGEGNCSEDYRG